jgi:hypothetical protein
MRLETISGRKCCSYGDLAERGLRIGARNGVCAACLSPARSRGQNARTFNLPNPSVGLGWPLRPLWGSARPGASGQAHLLPDCPTVLTAMLSLRTLLPAAHPADTLLDSQAAG